MTAFGDDMEKLFLTLVKPLWDRISARITIHGQRYTLLEVQHTERMYRELMDELLYLDLANQRLQKTLEEVLRKCKCIDSDASNELLNALREPYPLGIGAVRTDDPEDPSERKKAD